MATAILTEQQSNLAIGDLLAQHGPVLLAAARLITLDEAEAQDVVQVTFEIALRRAHTLRDPGSLRAWLLAIVRNTCFTFLKKRGVAPTVELDEQAHALADRLR